jgi:Periplasmic glycine betaine/choline-binding (lipo)protein of an ABC-type transport system (osmoprotectant binding protein)
MESSRLSPVVLAIVAAWLITASASEAQNAQDSGAIVVASKPFGESFILTEMFSQLLEARGFSVTRRPGMGATEVAFSALRTNGIDVYPEYTGTGLLAILHAPPETNAGSVFNHVSTEFRNRFGVRWLPPLGFENTYAIAVRRQTADQYHLKSLSDLSVVAPKLSAGLTADFIGRKDGLPGLQSAYGLSFRQVRPLAQAVKYQALASGAVDVIDGYSTDGLIARYDLVVLADDRHFFPPYEAAALVSPRLQKAMPGAVAALTELSGRIDVRTMRMLNSRLEVGGEPVERVARSALDALGLIRHTVTAGSDQQGRESFARYMWNSRSSLGSALLRHILLVLVAVLAGILIAVPLGLWLEQVPVAAEPVIRAVGVLQTIPSIALLAFMVPLIGVGVWPALVALWLYSLYPIVRTTYSGVRDADPHAVYAARALGMTPSQVLRYVRLPLAAPSILAGVRTAAVIAVGTATLAAFIGAGGLGEPIATGLALADTRLILSGALPAAALALVVDALLAVVEKATTPAPLRHAKTERDRETSGKNR